MPKQTKTIPGLPGERWKPIPGAQGFMVSNLARVKSTYGHKQFLIKACPSRRQPHHAVRLRIFLDRRLDLGWVKNACLHTTVAAAHHGITQGRIEFIDGNPMNCRASNLASARRKKPQNIKRAKREFKTPLGKRTADYLRGNNNAFNDHLPGIVATATRRLTTRYRVDPSQAEHAAWQGAHNVLQRIRQGALENENNIEAYFFQGIRFQFLQTLLAENRHHHGRVPLPRMAA